MSIFLVLLASFVLAEPLMAQEMAPEYAAVLKTLARQGDYKDGVLKVNIPRNDVNVSVDGVATPTPFGFGGWIALAKGDHGDVMMGDLVLTEDEVNPVMSAVLNNGLDVTALHNHFFYETPRMFYMHVHGHGTPADIAKRIAPALALIGKTASTRPAAQASGRPIEGTLDAARLAKIVGQEGEQTGAVYKITIGRPDMPLKEMGAAINARMGLNTWAAFYGSDADAVVAGDVAMRAEEVTPVLKALRSNGIDVVAIHHHMTATEPTVYFLHYWGRGPAEKLAGGFRAAVDQTGHGVSAKR
jgi:biopolymer transport protein ExbD